MRYASSEFVIMKEVSLIETTKSMRKFLILVTFFIKKQGKVSE